MKVEHWVRTTIGHGGMKESNSGKEVATNTGTPLGVWKKISCSQAALKNLLEPKVQVLGWLSGG